MTRIRGIGAALLLALGMVAGGADATTRFWALQNVVFTDGRIAIGSFGYDHVTNVVTSWNIRVDGAPGTLPFTYVPADSTPFAGEIAAGLPQEHFRYIFSANVGSGGAEREIRLSVAAELEDSPSTVPLLTLDAVSGGYFSAECCSIPSRGIVSGSLVQVPFPPPVALVNVIEFYHAGFGHYFMSANAAEINALDTGFFTGWARTGASFKAYVTGSSAGSSIDPVCRYYGLPSAGIDSHFYSADPVECWRVNQFYGTEWQIESDNVFQIDLPNTTTGACPGGTIPVYRVFNGRHDANHRYTTSPAVRASMEALGWIREGYGPDATIMCAIP